MEVLIAAACLYAALMLGRVVCRSIEPVMWAWSARRAGQFHTHVAPPIFGGRRKTQPRPALTLAR